MIDCFLFYKNMKTIKITNNINYLRYAVLATWKVGVAKKSRHSARAVHFLLPDHCWNPVAAYVSMQSICSAIMISQLST